MKIQIGQHTLEITAPIRNNHLATEYCSVSLNGKRIYGGFNPFEAWGLFEALEKALLTVEAQAAPLEESLHDW
ncbi:hypothetical protein [Pseudomonas phage vB_PaeM_PAO1_Ab17]|uniref:Uncharacterized protein n=2 Tax=Nankokuvirus Ab03 TaxID=1925780 RepID=A0A0A1IWY5_9CAUD|nr:hypothetical protein VC54_gp057 [Pseudomonas phage vB_PaeM_PAO1_Ab03]CEF89259.1 hypothetical protein [Pseudomonas phage vB_PaeM_PAO1_Ab03]CEF89637.1 hypothetical protein [Pseudomonas phage vB_PaeM_PAO1_Ab17]